MMGDIDFYTAISGGKKCQKCDKNRGLFDLVSRVCKTILFLDKGGSTDPWGLPIRSPGREGTAHGRDGGIRTKREASKIGRIFRGLFFLRRGWLNVTAQKRIGRTKNLLTAKGDLLHTQGTK